MHKRWLCWVTKKYLWVVSFIFYDYIMNCHDTMLNRQKSTLSAHCHTNNCIDSLRLITFFFLGGLDRKWRILHVDFVLVIQLYSCAVIRDRKKENIDCNYRGRKSFSTSLRIKLHCLCYSAAITVCTCSKRLFKVQTTLLNSLTVWGNVPFLSCMNAVSVLIEQWTIVESTAFWLMVVKCQV